MKGREKPGQGKKKSLLKRGFQSREIARRNHDGEGFGGEEAGSNGMNGVAQKGKGPFPGRSGETVSGSAIADINKEKGWC